MSDASEAQHQSEAPSDGQGLLAGILDGGIETEGWLPDLSPIGEGAQPDWTRSPTEETDSPLGGAKGALEEWMDSPWFGGGGDEISVQPLPVGGRLDETCPIGVSPEVGDALPGSEAPATRDPGIQPVPATDFVGEWGLPAEGRPVALRAGDHVCSRPTEADAEAEALQTPGATVVLASEGSMGGFSVFRLQIPEQADQFTRVNVQYLTGGHSKVYAEPGVLALVTVDGFLLSADDAADARFEDDTVALWAEGGVSALGEDPIPSFERAMGSTLQMFLTKAREGAEDQAKNNDPAAGVPVAERLLKLNAEIAQVERRRAHLLRPIRGVPPTKAKQREGETLGQQAIVLRAARTSEANKFPLLQSVDDLEAYISASDDEREHMLGEASADVVVAVANIEGAFYRGDLDLFAYAPLVMGTLALLGIGEEEPVYTVLTDEMQRRKDNAKYLDWFMTGFQLGAAVLGGMATGGVATAAIVAGAAAGLMDAKWMTEDYFLDQDLEQLGSGDPDVALIDEGTLGYRGYWVALAWLGLGLDVMDVFKAVKGLRGLFGKGGKALEEAIEALAPKLGKTPDELLDAMRSVDGLKMTDDHLPVLQAQLGVRVEVDADLGIGAAELSFKGDTWEPNILRVGPHAELFDVLSHKIAIDSCRRYDGISGRLRKVWDQVGGDGPCPFPPGSAEWAAHSEIAKLEVVIDNLRIRAAKAVDRELGEALEREAAFLESRTGHFEQVLAGLVAESDPRVIARMTQQTQEAYAKGFPPFEHYPGIDDTKYWYVKNDHAPPPYTVYHSQGTSPRLELVEDASQPSGFKLRPETKRVPHVFPAGTTKQQALEHITQERKSFGPYRTMLHDFGLANDDDILKNMVDPGGVTEDTLRHLLKEHYRPKVLDRMFEVKKVALTDTESIEAFHAMTGGLNSADAGNIGEAWFDRYSRTFDNKELEKHPSFTDSNGTKRSPDFFERGWKMEGNTAVEVKSTQVGLSASQDVPQITETLKLAEERGKLLVNGEKVKISQVRLVFTHASGAGGSLDALEPLFREYRDQLTVEVFFDSGPLSFTDIESLRATFP